VLGRFVFLRLRRALLPDFQRLWNRDFEPKITDVERRVAALEAELAELRAFKRQATVAEWTSRVAPLVERVDAISGPDLHRHVAAAIAGAELVDEPTPHMVVRDVLPDDVYELLVTAIPPADSFPDRDPVKRDYEMSALADAPPLTRRMWKRFDEEIVAAMVTPAVLDRLRPAIVEHYAMVGGRAFGESAAAIPHRPFAGRIQLRHPGYSLKPHLDPKRVAITGLFYFPRPGDSEDHGTQLYAIDRPVVPDSMATFFPEQAGVACTLARTVPYRRNSLFVFVNSRAAHGAVLPPGAATAERYTFQFYVKPDDGQLKKLLKTLPPASLAGWEEFL
jgi:hypothetical protein